MSRSCFYRRATEARAALLLEAVLALGLLVGASLAILSVTSDAAGSAARTRDRQRALDVAASALAKIQAGIETPESLAGQVPAYRSSEGDFDDAPPQSSGWELTIETEPITGGQAPHTDDLTLVRVSVHRARPTGAGGGSGDIAPVVTLSQVLRLRLARQTATGALADRSER